MHTILLAQQPAAIDLCFRVMVELRPHLTPDEFRDRVLRQIENERYQLAYIEEEDTAKAVAGFRLGENLAWGRFLYVDDLVTRETERSKGYGDALFDWLVDYARQHECAQLHLDSGVQRFGAHRFYLAHRMDITSHHFGLKL